MNPSYTSPLLNHVLDELNMLIETRRRVRETLNRWIADGTDDEIRAYTAVLRLLDKEGL